MSREVAVICHGRSEEGVRFDFSSLLQFQNYSETVAGWQKRGKCSMWNSVAMTKIICIVLLLGAAATNARARTASDFAGNWKGAKDTKGLAELRISQENDRWVARGFGACHPMPCDWGNVAFSVLQQKPAGQSAGLAIWRRGSSTRFVTLHLGEDALVAEIYSLFSGPRDQPSYFSVETLTKPASAQRVAPQKK